MLAVAPDRADADRDAKPERLASDPFGAPTACCRATCSRSGPALRDGPGTGSTFTVVLPVTLSIEATHKQSLEDAGPAPGDSQPERQTCVHRQLHAEIHLRQAQQRDVYRVRRGPQCVQEHHQQQNAP